MNKHLLPPTRFQTGNGLYFIGFQSIELTDIVFHINMMAFFYLMFLGLCLIFIYISYLYVQN